MPGSRKSSEAERKSEEPYGRDEPGCHIWAATSVPSLGLAVLGGILVAIGHDLILGVVAGLLGFVVGQVVSLSIASGVNSSTTTDPEWRRLADLPPDQRVGQGLRTRRKEKPLEVVREWLSIAIVFLATPAATLLTALAVAWIADH